MIKLNDKCTQFGRLNPSTRPKHLSISNIPVEVRCKRTGDRIGSKCPAEIDVAVGGLGRFAGLVAIPNGIEPGVVGVQATQHSSLCRELRPLGNRVFFLNKVGLRQNRSHLAVFEMEFQTRYRLLFTLHSNPLVSFPIRRPAVATKPPHKLRGFPCWIR